ncbi:hypothetical protein [Rathayibacter soli]|uniref:hypothetical protein n=1 Tax=Rathayibacter soli TaxID=3144168 RepID=UPI0027E59DCA|nr:hypothetical protein [Glaciibacter superstes]
MSVLHATDTVTIWPHDGAPTRLVWRGRTYQVTDTPTQLSDLLFGITHPPQIDGWRFQGTDDAGESKVFDVRHVGGAEWVVVNVYD